MIASNLHKMDLVVAVRAELSTMRKDGSIAEADLLAAVCDEIERLCGALGVEENDAHWLRESIAAIQAHCTGLADGEEDETLVAIEHICAWALREMLCDCESYRETGACSHITGIN